jgi:hypothetical protein
MVIFRISAAVRVPGIDPHNSRIERMGVVSEHDFMPEEFQGGPKLIVANNARRAGMARGTGQPRS